MSSQSAFRLGTLQMTSSAQCEDNLACVARLLNAQPPQPGDLVLLPENFALMATPETYQQLAEPLGDGPIQHFLAEQASRYQITLVAGSLPTQVAGEKRCHTTSMAFSSDGRCVASYHKLHLFDVDVADAVGRYRESDSFIGGSEPTGFDWHGVRVGLSICYDLRFATLYQWHRSQGAQVLLVPAAFTEHTGQAHWETLLRARAIEQQCYVVAAAQSGAHGRTGRRRTWGHSMIIDPWGDICCLQAQGEGINYVPFDADKVSQVRQQMPMHPHLTVSWSK